jgi:folate-binding protein YgfZ
LSGKDVSDFLHRLSTIDTRKLGIGAGAPGFLLESRGKIVAPFELWRIAETEFALEFDAGQSGAWRERLIQTIDRFHFGEDLTISEVSTHHGPARRLECRWFFVDPKQGVPSAFGPIQPGETRAIDEEIRIFHHGNRQFGRAWISAWGRPARLAQRADLTFAGAERVGHEVLESWRIESLGAAVDHEITPEVNPLEIGLRAGVAEQKGCYPGQEVLEKILALGAPARRLVLLEGEGLAPPPGTPATNLAAPPAEVGVVTSSVVLAGGRVRALVLVRKLQAKLGLEMRAGADFTGTVAAVAPYETES